MVNQCESPYVNSSDVKNLDREGIQDFGSSLLISSVSNYNDMQRQMKKMIREDQDEWYRSCNHQRPSPNTFDQNLDTCKSICLVTETKFKPPDLSSPHTVHEEARWCLAERTPGHGIVCLYSDHAGQQSQVSEYCRWRWCDGVPWADSHILPPVRVVPGYWMTEVTQHDPRENQYWRWCDGVPWISTHNLDGIHEQCLLSETKFKPPGVCTDHKQETEDLHACRRYWWKDMRGPSVCYKHSLKMKHQDCLVVETKYRPQDTTSQM